MTSLRFRWIVLVIVLGVFGYYLLPTVRFYSMDAERRTSDEVSGIRENAMKLGLDLQGGSYLVYEVDVEKIPPEERTGDEVERAIEIIRNRVDMYGVTEPLIQQQGENRIVVQLPGLQEGADQLVGQTAQLQFLLVKNRQEFFQAMSAVDQVAAKRYTELGLDQPGTASTGVEDPLAGLIDTPDPLAGDTTTAAADTGADLAAADTGAATADTPVVPPVTSAFSSLFVSSGADAGIAFCPGQNLEQARRIYDAVCMNADRTPRVLAGNTILLWGAETFGDQTTNPGRYLYALTPRAELTGEHIENADVAFNLDPTRPNVPGVSLSFDRRGAGIFTRLTGNNVGNQLAIVLDNVVKSAPFIRDKIRGGNASITGLEGDAEAKNLTIVLRAGALPTDLVLQEERTVGPSLGRDSIEQGVRASGIGLALVIVIMLVYYRASGALAVLALLLNLFLLMSALGMLRGTLTLPGIAGIVLTIGMAVDANVLVLERIREELRNGRTVKGAIDAGYGRALVTILDSNLTTLISAIVLSQFGTGPIKGFATTLMIGIVANIFTAVFVTRLIYDTVLSGRQVKKLSI